MSSYGIVCDITFVSLWDGVQPFVCPLMDRVKCNVNFYDDEMYAPHSTMSEGIAPII